MDAVATPQATGTPVDGTGSSNGTGAGTSTGTGVNGVNAVNSVNGGSPLVTMDAARVVEHLAQLLEAALGATREELEAPGSLLSTGRYSDTLQRCTRFANDALVSMYIQKDIPATPPLENGDTESSMAIPFPPLAETVSFGQTMLTASLQNHCSIPTPLPPICSHLRPPWPTWFS